MVPHDLFVMDFLEELCLLQALVLSRAIVTDLDFFDNVSGVVDQASAAMDDSEGTFTYLALEDVVADFAALLPARRINLRRMISIADIQRRNPLKQRMTILRHVVKILGAEVFLQLFVII